MGLIRLALGFLPGWGWVASVATAAVEIVGRVLGAAFQGLTVIFANPVTLVTVGFVAMAAFSTGLVMGSKEGRLRVASMTRERDDANRTAQQRLAEALAARQAAEDAEARRSADISSVAPPPPAAAAVRSGDGQPRRRVQQPPAKPSAPRGLCVPGFPNVVFGCD